MSAKTSFADATAVKSTSSHSYEAYFYDDWCIGSVPHGGYVTCVFLRVAQAHFASTLARQDQPNTVTVHLEFLRRTSVGQATFHVRDVKLGRQTSTLHISLMQGDREEVVGYLTNTKFAGESGPTLPTDWSLKPAPPPSPVFEQLRVDKDENWALRRWMPFRKFRKATTKLLFYFPRKGQTIRGAGDEWVTFATPDTDKLPLHMDSNGGEKKERFNDISVGFICDMWPQIIDTHGEASAARGQSDQSADEQNAKNAAKTYWYPTLLLNLDIKKALPAEGVEWLFARVGAKQIKNGRYDLEVVILDENEDLVALSHHVAFALPVDRNTAKRSNSEKQQKL